MVSGDGRRESLGKWVVRPVTLGIAELPAGSVKSGEGSIVREGWGVPGGFSKVLSHNNMQKLFSG